MAFGTFSKLGQSKKKMYGPAGLLVCGYQAAEQSELQNLLKELDLAELPLIFITKDEEEQTLEELLALPDSHGSGRDSGLRRAIIMSGLTEGDLQRLMIAYRQSELPPQMWATLTPISEKWQLKNLLTELEAENLALKKRRQQQASQNIGKTQ